MTPSQFSDYIKLHGKNHIIFDFDETLCTLRIDWSFWTRDILHTLQSYDPEYSGRYTSIQSAMNDMVRRHGKELRDKLIQVNYLAERDHFYGYVRHEAPLAVLREAAVHATVYLWTSNDRKTIEPILKELRLDHVFSRIVANDDVMYIKPDPDGFFMINERDHPVSSFLMVGDSVNDEGASTAAGIEFMHVSSFDL